MPFVIDNSCAPVDGAVTLYPSSHEPSTRMRRTNHTTDTKSKSRATTEKNMENKNENICLW